MSQRARALQPELSAFHLLGARLRLLREQQGLSQQRLGHLVFCSGDLIGKIEKAERQPQQDLLRRCDEVLGATNTLIDLLPEEHTHRPDSVAGGSVVAAHLPALRQVLDRHDFPDDGPYRPPSALQREVNQIVNLRLNSRYVELAEQLPLLLPELQRAMQHLSGSQRRTVAGLLTQAYRAADAIADKFGLYDLSARIIELMRSAAAECGDELTVAAVSYVRAETFLASGSWNTGRRMLEKSASSLHPQSSTAALATYGSLHMRAAILAARSGDRAGAYGHLTEATNATWRTPEGVYRGTAFGVASVRIHRLSLAVDVADEAAALAAGDWIPPTSVPAERRSHFFVDLARAKLLTGRPDEALDHLHAARRIAPQHIRYHPDVRSTLAQMLTQIPRPSQDLLRLARWTGTLTPGGPRGTAGQEVPTMNR